MMPVSGGLRPQTPFRGFALGPTGGLPSSRPPCGVQKFLKLYYDKKSLRKAVDDMNDYYSI